MGLFGKGGLGGFLSDSVETLGDFIPGIGDARSQDKANAENINQAQVNRSFQERMSSTAYQRAMADMTKAGLNPGLAYMQGGASAPSGATATVSAAPKTELVNKATSALMGVNSQRQQATALDQQNTMNESTINLNKATAAKTLADTEKSQVETRLKKKDIPRADLEGELSGKASRLIKDLMNSFSSSAKDAKNLFSPKGIKVLGPAPKAVEPKWLKKP